MSILFGIRRYAVQYGHCGMSRNTTTFVFFRKSLDENVRFPIILSSGNPVRTSSGICRRADEGGDVRGGVGLTGEVMFDNRFISGITLPFTRGRVHCSRCGRFLSPIPANTYGKRF